MVVPAPARCLCEPRRGATARSGLGITFSATRVRRSGWATPPCARGALPRRADPDGALPETAARSASITIGLVKWSTTRHTRTRGRTRAGGAADAIRRRGRARAARPGGAALPARRAVAKMLEFDWPYSLVPRRHSAPPEPIRSRRGESRAIPAARVVKSTRSLRPARSSWRSPLEREVGAECRIVGAAESLTNNEDWRAAAHRRRRPGAAIADDVGTHHLRIFGERDPRRLRPAGEGVRAARSAYPLRGKGEPESPPLPSTARARRRHGRGLGR